MSDVRTMIESFFQSVHNRPSTAAVFNPWRDFDPENDISEQSPEHRMSHLKRYISEREKSAKILLIAEAPGYQGAKFSGCAMTSERRLLGTNGALSNPYFDGEKFRTSRAIFSSGKRNPKGSLEPTATIVWDRMLGLCESHGFVLWNAFAWHPHHIDSPLTNRTPSHNDLNDGLDTLQAFLAIFPNRPVVAAGRNCEAALHELGVPHQHVRHPANGGATEFRAGMSKIISTKSL